MERHVGDGPALASSDAPESRGRVCELRLPAPPIDGAQCLEGRPTGAIFREHGAVPLQESLWLAISPKRRRCWSAWSECREERTRAGVVDLLLRGGRVA